MRRRHAQLAFALALALLTTAGSARAQVSPGPLAAAHRELDRPLDCFQCHTRPGTRETMDDRCLACHQEIGEMRAERRGFHAGVTDKACATCHPDHAGRDFKLVAWDAGGPEAFDHRRAGWALEGKHAAAECRDCHRPALQAGAVVPRMRVRDHARSWLGLETRCATCHEDEHRGQLGAACQNCHGLEGWKPAAGFDHAKSRYPLTGKHVDVACEKCHTVAAAAGRGGAAAPPARAGLVSAHPPGEAHEAIRYRPVGFAECSACHRDPHARRFGAACAKCHTTRDFRTVSEAGFDHDRTRYPLRGRHTTVPCASCHDPKKSGAKRPAFATCGSCHRDAHAGQATLAGQPADCAACHVVESFARSTFTVAQHAKTPYPLEGAHVRAMCALCHVRATGTAAASLGSSRVVMRPAREACATCHRDPHQGRFAKAAGGGRVRDCVACHGMAHFRPSSLDVSAHDAFAFRLEGAHRAVPCQACHAELREAAAASSLRSARGRALTFTQSRTRCADCHESPHGDQFARRRDGGACESCHGLAAFTPADHFDHNRDAAFRLEGAHARARCAACHRTERTPKGPRVIWKPVPSRCESCHAGGVPDKSSSSFSHPIGGALAAPIALTTREVSRASFDR